MSGEHEVLFTQVHGQQFTNVIKYLYSSKYVMFFNRKAWFVSKEYPREKEL